MLQCSNFLFQLIFVFPSFQIPQLTLPYPNTKEKQKLTATYLIIYSMEKQKLTATYLIIYSIPLKMATWSTQNRQFGAESSEEQLTIQFHTFQFNCSETLLLSKSCRTKLEILAEILSGSISFQILPGVEITVGQDKEDVQWPYAGTAGAVEQMGAKHVNKDVNISFHIIILLIFNDNLI